MYVVTILFLKIKTLHWSSFGLLCHLVLCNDLQTAFCYSLTCGVFPLRLSNPKKQWDLRQIKWYTGSEFVHKMT